jgi:hypothetical protein
VRLTLKIVKQNDGDFVNVILLLTLCHEAVSWSACLVGGLANLSPFGGELTVACLNICSLDTHRVGVPTICRKEHFLPLLRTEAPVGRPARSVVNIGSPTETILAVLRNCDTRKKLHALLFACLLNNDKKSEYVCMVGL